jgi:hypothetical protein
MGNDNIGSNDWVGSPFCSKVDDSLDISSPFLGSSSSNISEEDDEIQDM